MTTHLSTRGLRQRYGGIHARTVERWVKSGILPPPIYINGRKYWDADELDERDRERRESVGGAS